MPLPGAAPFKSELKKQGFVGERGILELVPVKGSTLPASDLWHVQDHPV